MIAQAQQDAHLPGAERQQRRGRHPAAHHVRGAQRVDPAEAQAAGPAHDGHHRQRQGRHAAAGQQQGAQVSSPPVGQGHRDEAQRQQRRQLHLRRQRDQDGAGHQHAQRFPVGTRLEGARQQARGVDTAQREFGARQHQAQHQRLVVHAGHQMHDQQRIGRAQPQRADLGDATAPGQPGRRPHDQCDAEQLD